MNGYEIYGELARDLPSSVVLTGRYSFQGEDLARAVADVTAKLAPGPSDRLLEIGCNVGYLLTPLSRHVAEAVGVDHPRLLDRYREAGVPANVRLYPGRWPDQRAEGDFDRIVVYGVIQYVPDAPAILAFVDACLDALRPGGRLLIGDLPNADAKARFLGSDFGKGFLAEWQRQHESDTEQDTVAQGVYTQFESPPPLLWSDRSILDLVAHARGRGFEGYLLPQPDDLPFGNTREDLLFVKRR